MDVVRHDDPKAFAARTQPFLMADEARHNLLLGITTTLIERPDFYQEFHLWVVEEQRETVAAAICTPPFNLAVSRSGTDGAMAALAEGLRHDGVTFPGVSGAVPEVEDFVEAWTALIGAAGSPAMASRIYRLTNVKPVDGVSGHLRDATQEDRDLLIDWIGRFATEALPPNDPWPTPTDGLGPSTCGSGPRARGSFCGTRAVPSRLPATAVEHRTGSASGPFTPHRISGAADTQAH
jgi:uncharacterized protein